MLHTQEAKVPRLDVGWGSQKKDKMRLLVLGNHFCFVFLQTATEYFNVPRLYCSLDACIAWGWGCQEGCKTLQGDYFRSSKAPSDASSGLLVVFPRVACYSSKGSVWVRIGLSWGCVYINNQFLLLQKTMLNNLRNKAELQTKASAVLKHSQHSISRLW